MTNESILSQIDSVEKYEAMKGLLDLLTKFRYQSSVKQSEELEAQHGYDYKRCEYCDAPKCECHCDDYPDYDYDYDFEDDEKVTSLEEGNRSGHESVSPVEGDMGSDVESDK